MRGLIAAAALLAAMPALAQEPAGRTIQVIGSGVVQTSP